MLPTIKTILYATDLSDHTRPVFRMANSLARQYQAKVIFVHALEPMGTYGQAVIENYIPKETIKQLRRDGYERVAKEIRERLDAFCNEELNSSAEECEYVQAVVIKEGTPAQVILKEANDHQVDLIVMGTHGQSALSDVLIGSSARKVTQKANCPVMVVPIRE